MIYVFDPVLDILIIIFIFIKLFQLVKEGKFSKNKPKSDYELRIEEVKEIIERIKNKIEKL